MSGTSSGLNPRERLLLTITIAIVVVVMGGGLTYKAREHLSMLDRRVENAEQELINLHTQLLQRDSVEAAFNQVVAEHSTQMSQEEVHDSLRREIYRLALGNPDQDEVARSKAKRNQFIVTIPELREGVMRDDGQGYREYQIRFRIPATRMMPALLFLSRLESSPLLLRVDELDFSRANPNTDFSLSLEVTRTVLDDVENTLGAREGDLL